MTRSYTNIQLKLPQFSVPDMLYVSVYARDGDDTTGEMFSKAVRDFLGEDTEEVDLMIGRVRGAFIAHGHWTATDSLLWNLSGFFQDQMMLEYGPAM